MWRETRGQTAIEVGLMLALAMFVATVVGLIGKSLYQGSQAPAQEGLNAVVNTIN